MVGAHSFSIKNTLNLCTRMLKKTFGMTLICIKFNEEIMISSQEIL